MPTILVLNPNTSKSITAALERAVSRSPPPGFDIAYFTPTTGVPSINDEETAAQSRDACVSELKGTETLSSAAGILVCCFSDHPLIPALQALTPAPVIGMFHAGISTALIYSGDFGIITTGTGDKHGLIKAVPDMLGGAKTPRYTGPFTTGLGVVELQEGDQERVKRLMQETTIKAVDKGAKTLLLGCAGMSGMEGLLIEAAKTRGVDVKVIDAARAGVGMVATLIGLQA